MTYKPILRSLKLNYDDVEQAMNKIQPLQNYPHDIDYSDKAKKHEWDDESDYWYEDNGQEVLFVTFAGMGWKNPIPTFIFHS